MPFFARLVLVAAILVAGCGRRPPPPEPTEPPRVEKKTPPPVYGETGELLESDVRIAGLPMPRGLELLFEEEGRHSYRGKLPVKKVLDYFGVRLMTGEVNRIGLGASYRNATPRNVKGAAVPMHVTILSVPEGVQVDVEELKVIDIPAEDPIVLQKKLREHFSQLD